MSDPDPDLALEPALHETSDVRFTSILGLLALIGGGLLLMLAVAWLLFPNELSDNRFSQPFPEFPAPVLQTTPTVDMAKFRAQKLHYLNSAGWVDRSAGTVHIPIAQAMADVAAAGIPDWPTQVSIAPDVRQTPP
jgi:hypothetical protein